MRHKRTNEEVQVGNLRAVDIDTYDQAYAYAFVGKFDRADGGRERCEPTCSCFSQCFDTCFSSGVCGRLTRLPPPPNKNGLKKKHDSALLPRFKYRYARSSLQQLHQGDETAKCKAMSSANKATSKATGKTL